MSRAPKLVHGWIDPDSVTPVRINFNPAFQHNGVPAGYGGAPIRPHAVESVRESFAKHGVVNPVFLWARAGRLWVRWGGSRVWHAQEARLEEMHAIIADYDGEYDHLEEVDLQEAMELFVDPPDGILPNYFEYTPDGDIDLNVTLWREAYGT